MSRNSSSVNDDPDQIAGDAAAGIGSGSGTTSSGGMSSSDSTDVMDAAGGGLSAFGKLFQGAQNSAIANFNADIATQNAATILAQGKENARRALLEGTKMIGTEAAGFSAAGNIGSSSQLALRASAEQNELNALTIQNNAEIKAAGYHNEAALNQYRAYTSQLAGEIGAISGVVTTAGALA